MRMAWRGLREPLPVFGGYVWFDSETLKWLMVASQGLKKPVEWAAGPGEASNTPEAL